MWSAAKWCEVQWSDVKWMMWSEVMRSEVEWCEVQWSALKWSDVKWCAVKWCEVKILGKMCVLSLIYSYVAVRRICAVPCVIIICFFLLFSNYATYVFNILFMFSCFVYLFSILCILCFCIVSPSVYGCLFPIFVQDCRSLPPGANPTAVNNLSHHTQGRFVSNNTLSAPKHDWISHITAEQGLQLAYRQVHQLHSMHHSCGSALWKTNGHIDCRHSF